MRYLVDTDWLIDALYDRGAALDVLEALTDRGLAVSIVSLGELYEGVVGRPSERANIGLIDRFVNRYDVIALSEPILLTFARVRRELRRAGRPLEDLDILIAATALDTG